MVIIKFSRKCNKSQHGEIYAYTQLEAMITVFRLLLRFKIFKYYTHIFVHTLEANKHWYIFIRFMGIHI